MELTRLKRQRATDEVYQALRQSILGHLFAPGQRLQVEEIASKLGVSLTPVRHAIQQLATEGLIEIRPRSGTFIAQLTARDIEETSDIRCALECLAAEKAVSQKESDDSKSALETAEASLKQVQAQANEARLNLGYTRVVAPIAGTTGIASKADGSLVTTADSLLTTIVQTNPIYVNFSVSESDFLRMNKQLNAGQLSVPGKRMANGSLGFEVKVKQADGSIFARAGKMNFASEKVNPQTGSIDARAEIPNPDGSLRPGQFVRVMLSGASRPNSISVPQRAVIDSPFGKIVFTVSPDNKLAPRPVELGGWTHGEWIVTKGLQSGDRVLVEGFIKAHEPGMVVKPVPYVPAPAGPGGEQKSAPLAAPAAANPAAAPTAPASSAAK